MLTQLAPSASGSILGKLLWFFLKAGSLKRGFEVAQSSVAKYMVKRRGPPSQGWRTFLRNHAPDIAAMDLFIAPTIGFDLLYAFVDTGVPNLAQTMSAHQISDAEKMASEWKPTSEISTQKAEAQTEFRPLMVRDGEAIVQWQLVSLPPAPISANLLFSIGTLKKTALVWPELL
jgi:hypothetical protein